jgi:hypothetical protein
MRNILIFTISVYQRTLSRVFVRLLGNGCRFDPTCSEYAITALRRFGVIQGIIITLKRIVQCHPFSRRSHFDPVPSQMQ